MTENIHSKLAVELKDGRIQQAIFTNAEREDVRNRRHRVSVVEQVGSQHCDDYESGEVVDRLARVNNCDSEGGLGTRLGTS